MVDLMKASDARKIVEEMEDERGLAMQRVAKEEIEAAVKMGARSVDLDVKYKDHERLSKWLKKLGYTINAGDSQRDGSWFKVSW